MLTITHVRRLLAPGLLAGLLLTAAPVATPVAQAAGPAVAPAELPRAVPPYRVEPGVRLKEKPPPWVLPVDGYRLTGRFGASSGLWASTHTGLDFAAPEGTPLRAVGPGVVESAAYDGAFGNKTVLRLDDGTVLWYAHQSTFAVSPGQRVGPGDLIGYVGSTGNVTGPHLHLEVHRGESPVDPEAWLSANVGRP